MEHLYIGSKSEGDYPLLKADDGQAYRLYVKSDMGKTPELTHLIGCPLLVSGKTDLIRGFRRIVTTMGDIQVIDPSGTASEHNMIPQENVELDGNKQ